MIQPMQADNPLCNGILDLFIALISAAVAGGEKIILHRGGKDTMTARSSGRPR